MLEIQKQALEIRDLRIEKKELREEVDRHEDAHKAIASRYRRMTRAFYILQKRLIEMRREGLGGMPLAARNDLVSPADPDPSVLKMISQEMALEPGFDDEPTPPTTAAEARNDALVAAVLQSASPPRPTPARRASQVHLPPAASASSLAKPHPRSRASMPGSAPSRTKGRPRSPVPMSESTLLSGSLYVGRGLGMRKAAAVDPPPGTRGSVRHVLSEMMKSNSELERLRSRERSRFDA